MARRMAAKFGMRGRGFHAGMCSRMAPSRPRPKPVPFEVKVDVVAVDLHGISGIECLCLANTLTQTDTKNIRCIYTVVKAKATDFL